MTLNEGNNLTYIKAVKLLYNVQTAVNNRTQMQKISNDAQTIYAKCN